MSIEFARLFSLMLLCVNCVVVPLGCVGIGWWLRGRASAARTTETQSVWDFWKRFKPAPPVRRPKEL